MNTKITFIDPPSPKTYKQTHTHTHTHTHKPDPRFIKKILYKILNKIFFLSITDTNKI